MLYLIYGGSFVALLLVLMIVSILLRTVVGTNFVHIVQSGKRTVSYGKDQSAGNVYWAWPSWVPVIGITTSKLPVSIFSVKIDKYHAYDKDRVPFLVDIVAFFRITESNIAAQRVASVADLLMQLDNTLRGAIRSILATHEIHEILEGRSKFGAVFTEEVDKNLMEWGTQTVKMIELMDIQDTPDSEVIDNIMAKKKSAIEMDSRRTVAGNMREAEIAEVEARQLVDIRKQEQLEAVGQRTAAQEQAVGIAKEQSKQEVQTQARETATREMAVAQVRRVREADIAREVQVVTADQQRQTNILTAEGVKQQSILTAEGALQTSLLAAQGIEATGKANAEAKRLLELAPVSAQVELAKEIGSNVGYQTYLISIRGVEATQAIGVAQAAALENAEVKIISNSGSPGEGLTSLMDLFGAKGGTQLGSFFAALKQTGTDILAGKE